MPFKDKDFDYVICAQVLEHVDDPIALVNELQRTATRGYLEVPSFIGESLFPKKSHKWVCLEINGKLVLFDKAKLPSCFPIMVRHPEFPAIRKYIPFAYFICLSPNNDSSI